MGIAELLLVIGAERVGDPVTTRLSDHDCGVVGGGGVMSSVGHAQAW